MYMNNKRVLLLIISMFSFIPCVFAKSYVATGDAVAIRNKATTKDSSVLVRINTGTVVEVLDETKKYDNDNNDCTSGWIKIKYSNIEGYTCSAYYKEYVQNSNDQGSNSNNNYPSNNTSGGAGTASNSRPWNTPKRAIVGGAEFISNGYISKGQFTSYLKKYNVNPNSYYSVYTHLYQANIAAPASEAIISWKSYYNNNSLNLAFNFNIPVYKNMKDSYNNPTGAKANLEKLDEVKDAEFEKKIADFPDSYKPYLRAIHQVYPKWTFTAMKTGLDFETAAKKFKSTGAINSTNKKLVELDDNGNLVATNESGWYRPNIKTVRYYLDPRNFLNESYVFMFENLSYFKVSEKVVQGVLNRSSLINGTDTIDNQSYASIFLEAGKNANVNPVYLASLAIQEMGNSKSNVSGESFSYKNITYEGLFNFFNIGAYSSESNPLKAGLVYAAGGVCNICAIYNTDSKNTINYYNQSLSIAIDTSNKEYRGSSIKPSIVIKDGNTLLKANQNYTVTYSNNKKVGTAIIKINGIGNYPFNLVKTFKIVPKNVSNLEVIVNDRIYNGNEILNKPVVKNGDTVLTEGVDYKLTYKNNRNVGTATVIVEGIGNYTGTNTKYFQITPNNIEQLNINVDLNKKEYAGKKIEPEVTIPKLTLNVDFEVKYENNINLGTASITVNGKGNYVGSKTFKFKIVQKKISKTNIEVDLNSKTYSGNDKKPKVVIKNDDITLKNKVDYTISYENNRKVGSAYIVITGIGNYKGTVKKTFYIIPKGTKISSLMVKNYNNVKVAWEKQTTQTTGYKIEYSIYSDFSKSKKVLVTKKKITSLTLANLKRRTKYYVRIRTYREINGKKYYSKWSKVKTIMTK